MEIEVAEPGLANAHCIGQHGLEHRLKLARRTRDDAQHFRCCGLLLQRLGKLPPCLGELTGARFELSVANVRSRLRSGRTKLATARWVICAFERQGHLVGTANWSPSGSAPARIEPVNPNTSLLDHL